VSAHNCQCLLWVLLLGLLQVEEMAEVPCMPLQYILDK